MSYYQSTVRYDKMLENGAVKRVSEKYLCDALSITEAVEVTTENLQPYISGEFEITKVERTPIAEVMGDKECGKFFLAKVNFIQIDEKTAKEKKSQSQWLIGAEDYDKAKATLTEEIRKCVADIEIAGLVESPIVDYYPVKISDNGK